MVVVLYESLIGGVGGGGEDVFKFIYIIGFSFLLVVFFYCVVL